MTDDDRLIEVQGTAEHGAFTPPADGPDGRPRRGRHPPALRDPAHGDRGAARRVSRGCSSPPRTAASRASSAACSAQLPAEMVDARRDRPRPRRRGAVRHLRRERHRQGRCLLPRVRPADARRRLRASRWRRSTGVRACAAPAGGPAPAARPSSSWRPSAIDPDRRARMVCALARRAAPGDARSDGRDLQRRDRGQRRAARRAGAADSATTRSSSCRRGMTTAELPEAEKDRISHRGRAVAAARPRLAELLGSRLAHRSRCGREPSSGRAAGGPAVRFGARAGRPSADSLVHHRTAPEPTASCPEPSSTLLAVIVFVGLAAPVAADDTEGRISIGALEARSFPARSS